MADTLIQGTTIIEDKRTGVGEYWSVPGSAFRTDSAATYDDDEEGVMDMNTGNWVWCPVNLPHGVTVKKVIVYGSGAETWYLYRKTLDATTGKETMATAAIDTEDSSITSDVIDNASYAYWLALSAAGNTTINGARIIYTA